MIGAVTVGATSTQILPQSRGARRQRVYLVNNSDQDIYVSPGGLAVSTEGIPLVARGGAYMDQPDSTGYIYQGIYTAICASGGKLISVTELKYL